MPPRAPAPPCGAAPRPARRGALRSPPVKWLLVFVLGGAGAVARVAVSGLFPVRALPWGTLAVNGVGCLLIGVLWALFAERQLLSLEWRIALVGGFLGGLTTFSAFGLETYELIAEGAWPSALAYVVTSVALGLVAVGLGTALGHQLS